MKALRWMLAAFAVGFLILSGGAAEAQQSTRPCWYNSSGVCVFVSAANPMPISGSFSATGFPTTQTTGTPISVTTGGVTGTLPSGAVVVATNVGTTNAAYCKLGASATTSDQYIAPSGGWFAFTVGAATQLTCITSTSTTTVNMVGGSGLATGTGGGSGGAALTNYALETGGNLAAILTAVQAPLAAGSATIGAVTQASGPWTVTPGATTPVTATMQSAAVASGNGTILNTTGMSAAVLTVNCATCSGGTQINFEISQDGTNFSALNASLLGSATAPVTTTQTSGLTYWAVSVSGSQSIRARISGYSAGTVTVTGTTVPVSSSPTTVQSNLLFGGTAAVGDPCQLNTPTIKPITITTNTTTNVLTGTSAKKIYICYLYIQTAAADNIAIISGTTGASCGANTAALVGGTTAANGLNNAANSGQAFGNGGYTVMQTQTNNDDICFITSAATPLAAVLKYVVQ